jgi:hypothetical protein
MGRGQVIALFYLILFLPRLLSTVALLLSVFVVVLQFSYWLTLSQFVTSTHLDPPQMSREEV